LLVGYGCRQIGEGRHLTQRDESLIAEVMARFGYSREEAIEDLILNGGITDSAAFV
jgi:hypothetical protein